MSCICSIMGVSVTRSHWAALEAAAGTLLWLVNNKEKYTNDTLFWLMVKQRLR